MPIGNRVLPINHSPPPIADCQLPLTFYQNNINLSNFIGSKL
jgi:hypothetical protein